MFFQFWDASTGVLKCVYGEIEIGVTGVNFAGKRWAICLLFMKDEREL